MRILIVEDEKRVASLVSRALEENGYVADVAPSGESALQMVQATPYGGILLDVRLPGRSGIEVCREIRSSNPDIPILMLTARGLVDQRVEGLDAGADDYLPKPFAVAELLARLQALLRRRAPDAAALLRVGDVTLDRRRRVVAVSGRVVTLTAKEFAVLEFVMLRAPQAVSRVEIIEHVWDIQFDPESNLVEVYINRLRQKLSPTGTPKLIHTLHGAGYCMRFDA